MRYGTSIHMRHVRKLGTASLLPGNIRTIVIMNRRQVRVRVCMLVGSVNLQQKEAFPQTDKLLSIFREVPERLGVEENQMHHKFFGPDVAM